MLRVMQSDMCASKVTEPVQCHAVSGGVQEPRYSTILPTRTVPWARKTPYSDRRIAGGPEGLRHTCISTPLSVARRVVAVGPQPSLRVPVPSVPKSAVAPTMSHAEFGPQKWARNRGPRSWAECYLSFRLPQRWLQPRQMFGLTGSSGNYKDPHSQRQHNRCQVRFGRRNDHGQMSRKSFWTKTPPQVRG